VPYSSKLARRVNTHRKSSKNAKHQCHLSLSHTCGADDLRHNSQLRQQHWVTHHLRDSSARNATLQRAIKALKLRCEKVRGVLAFRIKLQRLRAKMVQVKNACPPTMTKRRTVLNDGVAAAAAASSICAASHSDTPSRCIREISLSCSRSCNAPCVRRPAWLPARGLPCT